MKYSKIIFITILVLIMVSSGIYFSHKKNNNKISITKNLEDMIDLSLFTKKQADKNTEDIKDNKKTEEEQQDIEPEKNTPVFLALEREGFGYLNGPSVKNNYPNALKGENTEYHLAYEYPDSFTSVSDSILATSLVGQLLIEETGQAINSEVYIANVENIKALAPYKEYGMEFLINKEYQKDLESKQMYNDPTQVLTNFYTIKTDEYSGYAYDNTRNRLQHVGLPPVTTTIVTAIIKNNVGEIFQLGIVGTHPDAKFVVETLKF